MDVWVVEVARQGKGIGKVYVFDSEQEAEAKAREWSSRGRSPVMWSMTAPE